MRFSADICFKDKPPFKIPTNYRRNIASLIKESVKLTSAELYSELWEFNKTKPFTFALYIPNGKILKINNASFLEFDSDRITLTVSSADDSLLISIYNSLLNISGKYSPFAEDSGIKENVELNRFRLLKQLSFSGNKEDFRLMSPMIIRNNDGIKSRKGKAVEYLSHDDAPFKENFYHSVLHLCRDFISPEFELAPESLSFIPRKCSSVKVYHYKEAIPAISGTFSLEAPNEVLKLIYDAGIGARRSQGFGMVEAVR